MVAATTAAACVAAAPASALDALFCAVWAFAGAFGSPAFAALGSGLVVAVFAFAVGGTDTEVLPLLPFAADEADEFALPFADADVAVPGCCVPLLFFAVVPDPLGALVFAAGGCGGAAGLAAAPEPASPLLLAELVAPAEPGVVADVCCGIGGGLAGAGLVTPASSRAANGCVSMF